MFFCPNNGVILSFSQCIVCIYGKKKNAFEYIFIAYKYLRILCFKPDRLLHICQIHKKYVSLNFQKRLKIIEI